jgi:hypothetical protein
MSRADRKQYEKMPNTPFSRSARSDYSNSAKGGGIVNRSKVGAKIEIREDDEED